MSAQAQSSNQGGSPTANQSHKTHSTQTNNTNTDETDHDLDSWKHRPPYAIHDVSSPEFNPIWTGTCHCTKIRFQLSRRKPLNAKYCHCTTCQRLHGSPFQWAAIFHKTDINFTHGHHDLAWYDPGERTTRHKLPCKVSCAHCRTPIMDEGRNMILLFPTLIQGIHGDDGLRHVFRPTCHMFYNRRVVDVKDGLPKWDGLDGKSRRLDEDGVPVAET